MKDFEKMIYPVVSFLILVSAVHASPNDNLDPSSVRVLQEQTMSCFEEILAVKDDVRNLLLRSQQEEMPRILTDSDVQDIEGKIENALDYLRRAAQANTISDKRLYTSLARICVNSALAIMVSEMADFNNSIIHHRPRN